MGKMGLNFDIERLSYRSHCLFSLNPLPGRHWVPAYDGILLTERGFKVRWTTWRAASAKALPILRARSYDATN